MLKIEYIKTSKLVPNGANPRTIKNDDFQKLCKSIEENPLYFEARPILCNPEFGIFAGSMRYRAAKKLKLKEVPVIVMDISKEKQREYLVRDNVSAGAWDISILTAEFETEDLIGYGVDIEGMGIFTDTGFGEEVKLPNGERSEFTQITFTLSIEQAEAVKNAVDEAQSIAEEYDHQGNKNKNGNALYAITKEWLKQRI